MEMKEKRTRFDFKGQGYEAPRTESVSLTAEGASPLMASAPDFEVFTTTQMEIIELDQDWN